MASQEDWYKKLKSFVPGWFFEEEEQINEAVFQGLAALFSELELRADEHQAETFILQADSGYLDEHGFERNLTRGDGELDPPFAERIRNIINTSNRPAIKALVDALLEVGESTVVEDFDHNLYFNRESFFNRGEIFIDAIYNVFSIIVDRQVHAPYSFYDREYFYTREDFIGTNESSLKLFELIVDAVNRAKALGTLYRLVERVG